MNEDQLNKLRFPIGEFEKPDKISNEQISDWIEDIRSFPERLKSILKGLTTEELQWKYRPDGWMIKQVVHHCADSHMNSLIRFKLTLTEEEPIIRPYWEDRWAELVDSRNDDLTDSLTLLTGLHAKMTQLFSNIKGDDLKKEFIHPEHGKRFSLEENIGVYAWHSNHHLAHISQAIKSQGKYNEL